MPSKTLLLCEKLTIGYGENKVIQNISFAINEGDFLVILGENGSGKSTLIKSILGLISTISGSAKFFLDKKRIGYLPQQQEVQKDFPASVYEIVLSGFANRLKFRFFYTKDEKKAAMDNLAKMKMDKFAQSPFSQLSGGQRQRVLLARMLCAAEKIVFLDEPVSGLDSASQEDFYDIIDNLNKSGMTVVMVSHDKKCLKYATKVLELKKNWKFADIEEYKKGLQDG